MDYDYISIDRNFYFKDNTLYKKVYINNEWVFIEIENNLSIDDAIEERNKIIITIDDVKKIKYKLD